MALVLIETYWNVNVAPANWWIECLSINRNILECKSGRLKPSTKFLTY